MRTLQFLVVLIIVIFFSNLTYSTEYIKKKDELKKIEEDLKASVDVFTIDPIKYKISEKIKKSFDPKRIFNPGKMYSGI